jgi:hypothetical protein
MMMWVGLILLMSTTSRGSVKYYHQCLRHFSKIQRENSLRQRFTTLRDGGDNKTKLFKNKCASLLPKEGSNL